MNKPSVLKVKCGFCGALKKDISDNCPQIRCQKVQDEAREAAIEKLGLGFMERDEDANTRRGFIRGYYCAKLKL